MYFSPGKTNENKWKAFGLVSPEFATIPLNFPRIPRNSPRLHWPGKASVFFLLPPCPGRILPVSWNPAQTFWWPACSSGFHQLLVVFLWQDMTIYISRKLGGNSGKIGEFWVNFGENWWISGELGGNSVEIGGKLVNCVSPMVKQNSQTVKSISPTSGKKGKNEGKLFRNRWGKWKGNEREFRFHDQFQLHSTVSVFRGFFKFENIRNSVSSRIQKVYGATYH